MTGRILNATPPEAIHALAMATCVSAVFGTTTLVTPYESTAQAKSSPVFWSSLSCRISAGQQRHVGHILQVRKQRIGGRGRGNLGRELLGKGLGLVGGAAFIERLRPHNSFRRCPRMA